MIAKKTLVFDFYNDERRELSVLEDSEFKQIIQIQIKQDGNEAFIDLYKEEVEDLCDTLSSYLNRVK